jgi:hypothetical protein
MGCGLQKSGDAIELAVDLIGDPPRLVAVGDAGRL